MRGRCPGNYTDLLGFDISDSINFNRIFKLDDQVVGPGVADYRQLCDAVSFLKDHGISIRRLPAQLFPGMGPSVLAIDPSGHAIQLYHAMEQIGWDGKPRPAAQRPPLDNDHWPEFLGEDSDSYSGETFLGPWY